MLINTQKVKGLSIHATDGEIGKVDEIYFDDESWAVRYLTVETGSWLDGREVLISPYSIIRTDWQARQIEVVLSKKQVEASPRIDTHRPVSRQQEAEYLSAYGYPYYWEGPYTWGSGYYPTGWAVPPTPDALAKAYLAKKESTDSHLRSTAAVNGYHLEAKDGDIGHVCGFVLDDQAWALRYMEVATQNWWPGKKVLVSPAWVERVSWPESKVFVALMRDAIKNGPEYDEATPINREYENKLYVHFGTPPYWLNELAAQAAVFRARA
jgi:hypothetical protein